MCWHDTNACFPIVCYMHLVQRTCTIIDKHWYHCCTNGKKFGYSNLYQPMVVLWMQPMCIGCHDSARFPHHYVVWEKTRKWTISACFALTAWTGNTNSYIYIIQISCILLKPFRYLFACMVPAFKYMLLPHKNLFCDIITILISVLLAANTLACMATTSQQCVNC